MLVWNEPFTENEEWRVRDILHPKIDEYMDRADPYRCGTYGLLAQGAGHTPSKMARTRK
jgi:hypothetical protein